MSQDNYENKMMQTGKDIVKVCVETDCGNEFTFSVVDQEYFREKKYVPPNRCLNCRQARRLAKLKDGKH